MSHNPVRALLFAPGNDEHEPGQAAAARGKRSAHAGCCRGRACPTATGGGAVALAGEPFEHPRRGARAATAVRRRKELEP